MWRMVHRDSGWRPKFVQTYKGHEVHDHMLGPHEINEKEEDEDEFDWDELDELLDSE